MELFSESLVPGWEILHEPLRLHRVGADLKKCQSYVSLCSFSSWQINKDILYIVACICIFQVKEEGSPKTAFQNTKFISTFQQSRFGILLQLLMSFEIVQSGHKKSEGNHPLTQSQTKNSNYGRVLGTTKVVSYFRLSSISRMALSACFFIIVT